MITKKAIIDIVGHIKSEYFRGNNEFKVMVSFSTFKFIQENCREIFKYIIWTDYCENNEMEFYNPEKSELLKKSSNDT